MSDPGDRTRLLGAKSGRGPAPTSAESGPVYYDEPQSPTTRLMQLAFIVIVCVLVLISLGLSISQCVKHSQGLYIMLGLSLLGLLALEILMIVFIRRGDLAADKSWFLYVVGAAIALESIFTDILLFA